MERFFKFAGGTRVLLAMFAATVALLVSFQAVPVGGELLDVRHGYDHGEAIAALAGYGADGRRAYAWASATLDTLLPCALVTFLAGLVYRLRPTQVVGVLAWVPLSVGVFDFAENVQIIAMLVQFPDVSARQVASASAFTVAKTFAFVACFAFAVVAAGGGALWRALARRRTGD